MSWVSDYLVFKKLISYVVYLEFVIMILTCNLFGIGVICDSISTGLIFDLAWPVKQATEIISEAFFLNFSTVGQKLVLTGSFEFKKLFVICKLAYYA